MLLSMSLLSTPGFWGNISLLSIYRNDCSDSSWAHPQSTYHLSTSRSPGCSSALLHLSGAMTGCSGHGCRSGCGWIYRILICICKLQGDCEKLLKCTDEDRIFYLLEAEVIGCISGLCRVLAVKEHQTILQFRSICWKGRFLCLGFYLSVLSLNYGFHNPYCLVCFLEFFSKNRILWRQIES